MGKRRFKKANATGRTEGGEQFVPLGYPQLRSAAWRSLSGAAVKVFLEIRSRFNGANNGKLTLSLDEAARLLGIGKTTASRAFDELQSRGFLALTRRGAWYGRQASEYATTDRGVNGHLATHAWKHWRPSASNPKKHGLCSHAGHIGALTGPPRDREPRDGPATVPVRADASMPIGPDAGRL